MKTGTSLQYFLAETLPDSTALQSVLLDITRAAKYVQNAIQTTEHGLAGSSNTHGEQQIQLDVLSNDAFKQVLHESQYVRSFISEEEPNEVHCTQDGMFSVVFDPLDGSSLVDTNFAIGSIFGVYQSASALGQLPITQVAALYVLYGPRTVLVMSTGNGLHEFLLDEVGEFTLLRTNIILQPTTTYYSPGNLRALRTNLAYANVLERWLHSGATLRYSGCMVADIHHIFTKGHGIFCNVGGDKYPNGKLRHLFECGPFAFLIEQAGGVASNGTRNLTDVTTLRIDQREQIICGSKDEVEIVVKMLQH
jgi:fructose-1,6-bisphosphatase I